MISNRAIEKLKEIQNVVLKSNRKDIEVFISIAMPDKLVSVVAIKRKPIIGKVITSFSADVEKEISRTFSLENENILNELGNIKIEILNLYKLN